jgi:hypothetical protein
MLILIKIFIKGYNSLAAPRQGENEIPHFGARPHRMGAGALPRRNPIRMRAPGACSHQMGTKIANKKSH